MSVEFFFFIRDFSCRPKRLVKRLVCVKPLNEVCFMPTNRFRWYETLNNEHSSSNKLLTYLHVCYLLAILPIFSLLTEAYLDAISASDSRERTPLHFALSNAGRKTVPVAVHLLLAFDKIVVNSINDGPLPLRVLLEYSLTSTTTTRMDDEENRDKE